MDGLENLTSEGIEKLEKAALGFATESSPRLERMGLDYFERRSARRGATLSDDEVHILDEDEKRQLGRIQTGVVIRGCLIGAGSGAASAIASYLIIGASPTSTLSQDLAVIGITVIATIIEIALLYTDALRSVHELAMVAGINLGGAGSAPENSDRRAIATALARTAMELPTPPDNPYGINPHKAVSAWRLLLNTIIYKLKVTVTNFLIKLLVRRMAGRVALREWLYFIDIPVTATWDGAVAWIVIRNARICTMGPSAARALVQRVAQDHPALSDHGKEMLLRAAAVTVVRRESLHPNLIALLRELETLCGDVAKVQGPRVDDDDHFVRTLGTLEAEELQVVLEVLAAAVVLDGRVGRGDKRLMADVLRATGRSAPLRGLKTLNKHFLAGRDLTVTRLQRAIGTGSPAGGQQPG